MIVRKYMNTHVVVVAPESPLPEIWQLISQKHVNGLPVVTKDKKLLGFISKENILAKLFPESEDIEEVINETDEDILERLDKLKKLTVEKVMNPHPFFTRVDTNVMRALSRMIVRRVRQLPVLDDEDRVVGMLAKSDIFKVFFRQRKK